MAVAIVTAYRDLRGSIRARLEARPRDAQLLVYALIASVLGFVAGLPAAFRQAEAMDIADARTGVLAVRLFGAIFMGPLFLLCLAGLSHAVARLFGGKGSFWSARVALIWAVMVSLPLALLNGLASAVLPAPAALSVAVLAGLGFAWIWAVFLSESEQFDRPVAVLAALLLVPAVLALFSL